MCQATGTPVLEKYESDGGPGIEKIMEILDNSERAASDRSNFFMTQILFWLLAATDGHAKNFSIAHLPGNRYQATPLYDVISAHPIIGAGPNHLPPQRAKLAMAVHSKNVHYHLNQIQRRHWIAQGRRVGYSDDEAEKMIAVLTAKTEHVIDEVSAELPHGFPPDIAEAIFQGLRRSHRKLASTV